MGSLSIRNLDNELLAKATKLALALDHPACDCIYLVLAQTLGCDFVTADVGLQRRTPL